ncbi:hypothetical protein [Lyngbya sp. PCC 8106]|uniref:hypothetical protein n=1 Tax=Lyngbya sp. (strain PCC 8106) TaxID=313612 RepID=UPI0000EAAFDA|nr:hypothetical protein [Lyngbya sp. PCC 8106]EAW39221.1 hypothetical protein L8106_04746 [Lyngbya sp. PCC 8106]
MNNSSASPKIQAELDLLDVLLNQEQPYIWNTSALDSETELRELDEQLALCDCLTDEDVHHRLQSLLTQVEDLWSVNTLQKSLALKFADCVPQDLLQRLAKRAIHLNQQLQDARSTLAEQLVQCTQEILPHWQEEDLQVLARPFAYAMRGAETEPGDSTLNSTPTKPWKELSEIEQARMGLAIARYALSELEQHPQES